VATRRRGLPAILGGVSAALVRVSCRWPRLTLLFFLTLSVASIWLAAANLRIDTSTEDMLSPDLPFRQTQARLEAAFPAQGQTLVVVLSGPSDALVGQAAVRLSDWMNDRPHLFADVFYPEGDPFLRRHGLLYLSPDALAEQIDQLASAQGLIATLAEEPSLVGLSEVLLLALASGESEQLQDLVPAMEEMARTAEAVAAGKPALLSWRTLLSTEELPTGDALRIIIARPALNYASLAPAQATMNALDEAAEEMDFAADGVTLGYTGKPALRADELRSIRGNIAGIGLLSFVLVGIILWRGLGSGRAALSLGLMLLVGLSLTAGFATLAIGRLNLLSVAFAVLFIGLSVDYAIHSYLRMQEFRLVGLSLPGAAAAAARAQAPALWLCAASTSIAFLAFLPTEYLGLAELGLISAGGIAIALLLCFTILPATLLLLRAKAMAVEFGNLAGHVESGIVRHRRLVLTLAIGMAIGSALLLPHLDFDNDPLSLRDPDSPSVKALTKVLNDPRAAPYRAEVLLPNLPEANALADRMRALPEVASAITYSSFIPDDQRVKLDQLADASFLLAPLLYPPPPEPPPDQEARQAALSELIAGLRTAPDALVGPASGLAAALALVQETPQRLPVLEKALIGDLPRELETLRAALTPGPVTMNDLPANLRERYLAPDGQALLEIRPEADLRNPAARQEFVRALEEVWPGVSGEAVTIVEAGRAVIVAFAQASVIAFVLVAALVFLVLRRVDDSLTAMLPLILATLYCAGLTVVLGIELNFANVVVLPLLFGIGIDSGLHLVARRREAPEAPLLDNATPRAVLVSALTTLASFGSLSLSDHPGTASMGLLLMVSLICVLVAVFLVLPAIIGRAR